MEIGGCTATKRVAGATPENRLARERRIVSERFDQVVLQSRRRRKFTYNSNVEAKTAAGRSTCGRFTKIGDSLAGHLQRTAGFKVDEKQAGVRIRFKIAQRVEHVVAAIIRPDQRMGIRSCHKSGTSAAMGGIGSALLVLSGDEK